MAAQTAAGTGQTAKRRWPLFAIAITIAFLAGLIPMWMLAHQRAMERDANSDKLVVLQLENEAAAAAMYAKRGEYEAARQHASTFYTQLRSAVDNGYGLTDGQRNAVRPLLGQRDEVITLLARSDPAAVDRLFGTEYQLRQDFKAGH
jgi:hypothetical protein